MKRKKQIRKGRTRETERKGWQNWGGGEDRRMEKKENKSINT